MKNKFDIIYDLLIGHEGGYSDHPDDNGGKTKYGITNAVLKTWRRYNAGDPDIRKLTLEEAKRITKQWYWNPVRGDELPPGVDYAMFDMAYNSGVFFAIKRVQEVLGLNRDGVLGPRTMAKIEQSGRKALIEDIGEIRLQYMKHHKDWKVFGNGWKRRVAEVTQKAVEMANA